ncbi:MAG: ribbon-helix-helix domain-containing protein [Vulcanococcus sp.]
MNARQTSQPPQTRQSTLFRSPKRITITMPYGAYEKLQQRSDTEGRSLSNLAAYLLESAVEIRS